jgi:glyoxylase-like metal-dependent hydrolase (beta-lactamase superfamily II)
MMPESMAMNTMQVLNSAINVKQIVGFEPFKANCYVITKGPDAIIVDPCIPYEQAKRLVKNAKIRAVFLTHGHIDHFYYVEEYVAGEIDALYYHPKAYDKLSNTVRFMRYDPQKTPFTNTSKSHPMEEGTVEVEHSPFKS